MSVFHLKYRPRSLSELDSKTVRGVLKKILSNKEIPQVFLFAGPKGSGKTSAARIVAKAVNCLDLKEGEPCGKCKNCKILSNGTSIDIMEMDAASNRGIDDVRSLKDKVYLLPTSLTKKVFIIDEVHMMTKDAFNAFLKLLEEPPIHTVFILCTTDPEKIPETVLSRLIRVDFKKGGKEEMKDSLRRVAKGESLEIEDRVIEMIVERSEGSFRNAQKLLTELYLSCGSKIEESAVGELSWFSFSDYGEREMAVDLADRDLESILKALEKLTERGVDMAMFRQRLVIYFQDQLLATVGIKMKNHEEKGCGLSTAELTEWLQLLIVAGKQERDSVIPQLPLQLAVIEFLKIKDFKKIDNVSVEKNNGIDSKKEETKTEKSRANVETKINLSEIEEKWTNILAAIKPFNHSVEAFLRSARPIKLVKNTIRLEVFYPFHKDKLEEVKNRKIVENGLRQILGEELLVECVLGKLKRSNEPVVVVENGSSSLNTPELSGDLNSVDIYQVAKEIFG